MDKKAIIIGHTGQDGTYLGALLRERNYDVVGISSKNSFFSTPAFKRQVDITNYVEVESLVKDYQPHEIYYLAAVHQSSADKQIPDGQLFQNSFDVNVKGLVNFLESIKLHSPATRLFYAASSHVFGDTKLGQQDEQTPLDPNCIYGISKTAGIKACHFYRNNYHVRASVGIFYNHESPIRASKYVSKKIVETAVAIKRNEKTELVLGNLESKIDWGYAPDYMVAVNKILGLAGPGDFIISSGELHSVGDFVKEVFAFLELDWEKYVKINPALITKNKTAILYGNNSKLKELTGWSPTLDFRGMVQHLVTEQLKK